MQNAIILSIITSEIPVNFTVNLKKKMYTISTTRNTYTAKKFRCTYLKHGFYELNPFSSLTL